MPATLYLIETRAKREYACEGCGKVILQGSAHFRHDPHPRARMYRREATTHWCLSCILSAEPQADFGRRLRVPLIRVVPDDISKVRGSQLSLFAPIKVELLEITPAIVAVLASDATLIRELSPSAFEELVCDRLFAMGLEPKRVGATNQRDGGIDIVFWPRTSAPFPFLGAVQVKHHRTMSISEGPDTVREFAGAVAAYPFNAGMLVTNTTFSPDAKWFATHRAQLLRLREFADIRRWLRNNFSDEDEWREIPKELEICPGVTVRIR